MRVKPRTRVLPAATCRRHRFLDGKGSSPRETALFIPLIPRAVPRTTPCRSRQSTTDPGGETRRFTGKKRLVTGLTAASFAVALTVGSGVPAQAADGEVVVFKADLTPLEHYANPEGCHNLPLPLHHVLVNLTNSSVKLYNLPNCGGLSTWSIKPDQGGHTDLFLSFKV
ncbi:hypothetical protein I5Q34_28965 [Streptomyces sp. AV19]|uniref:hypothetical protein n=1 Tax=Streptomyces sp. AV19 TaxID=2793068 RepID=UPI0018FE539F|nr:hypothetical protein [Streptomyces sp. AV19]MBH1938243.1 hypothetical protein [Streptomyces sp. AV19]MDG4534873.1 hypothetical protein [Streptomyces sp. AV19]